MSEARVDAAAVSARLRASECPVADEYAAPLAQYLNLLVKWNRVYNLTGFRAPDQLLERVLVECLSIGRWLEGTRIADVGTGAGLPGLPLAISEPHRHFTLIESRAKRVRFLRHVVGELALANVTVEHSRAEDLPQGTGFATVLARAVAAPPDLIRIVRHLTQAGSRVVLMTGPQTARDFEQLPPDFALRQVVPSGAHGQFGVVVLLERTAHFSGTIGP